MTRPALRLLRGDEKSAGAAGVKSNQSSDTSTSVPPIDDARLLAAIQSGDEDAATELHDRLRPRVDQTIRSLLGTRRHSEHDDLAQQSFIEIVYSLERFRGECSLETWAATITARTVFKFLRRRTLERRIFRRDHESGENGDSGESVIDAAPSSSARLGNQLTARSLSSRIHQHLETMDADKAEAFLLHDVCGFDAREVAGIAGISEAAAHARIARGRRELHAILAADPELRDALVDLEVEP